VTRDTELRDLVRVASRLRRSRDGLSAERRAALKYRVMRGLDMAPRRALRERLAIILGIVSKPLPLVYRAGVAAVLVAAVVGAATMASADSLPDDPLYGVKLASEQARLSLAQAPQDLVAVELSIAETRLREATALVAQQRDAEADVAASAFGEHLAAAAAHLEPSRAQDGVLLRQIQLRLGGQRLPAMDPGATPNALSVLRSASREITAASPNAGSIADLAARAAEQAADLVTSEGDDDGDEGASGSTASTFAPRTAPPASSRVTSGAPTGASSSAARTARATATLDPKAKVKREAAIKAARGAAERARQAAERAMKKHLRDGEQHDEATDAGR